MKFYLEEKEKVLSELDSSEEGLASEDVQKRKEKYGLNKLAEAKKEVLAKLREGLNWSDEPIRKTPQA